MIPPDRQTAARTFISLTNDAAAVLRAYGSVDFAGAIQDFISRIGSLQQEYRRSRECIRVPLLIADGSTLFLSPGAHNKLQVAVVRDFGPRFAPGATVLYIGDTAKKHVV